MKKVVQEARKFAKAHHKEQRRPYTGRPYVEHLKGVAGIVSKVPGATPQMIAAAWLHDVVEDTPVDFDEVYSRFGYEVGELVDALTNYTNKDRQNAFELNCIRLEMSPAAAQTIKCADILHNVSDIIAVAPRGKALSYVGEKLSVLSRLNSADPDLRARAIEACLAVQLEDALEEPAAMRMAA